MITKSILFGPGRNDETVEHPEWNIVESALRSLDGDFTDGVILELTGNDYMGISGGKNDCFVVAGYLSGMGSFICASGQPDGPNKDVVVAGDYNNYPSKNVIDFETAIEAAKAFHASGKLSENLEWNWQ